MKWRKLSDSNAATEDSSPSLVTGLFIPLPSMQFSQVDMWPIAHFQDKKKRIDILVETSCPDNVSIGPFDDILNDHS